MLLEFAEADVQFSVQQLHRPVVSWKAKDTANCSYILLPIRNNWNYFSRGFFPINSVTTEQLQTCVKNLNPITIDLGNLICWWDNQLSWVKSRQKFFWIMTSHHTRIFHCNDMKGELRGFHNKTNWVNFAWIQDWKMLLKLDSISWPKTLKNNSFRGLVVNTLFQEVNGSSQPKGCIQGSTKIGPVLEVTTSCLYGKTELNQNAGSEWRQFSFLGLSFSRIKQIRDWFEQQHRSSWRSAWRTSVATECEWFCVPIKGKSKTTRREPVDSPSIIPMNERKWVDIEPRRMFSLFVRTRFRRK